MPVPRPFRARFVPVPACLRLFRPCFSPLPFPAPAASPS
ncbi:hypothetical protein DA2_2868 [Desulfovibrio sp. A2]|nr:hypothetical protein DA2_2868 [Desulfovibrio sp. A2]